MPRRSQRDRAATKDAKTNFTTKWAMSLRSPAENENGGISFHMVPSSTRHSRARGNPGLLRRISLDTRFRGYDGTQAGLLVHIPKRVFSKEDTKSTKLRRLKTSRVRNLRGLRVLRGELVFVIQELRKDASQDLRRPRKFSRIVVQRTPRRH